MADNKKFDLEEINTFFSTINPNKSKSTYTTMKYNLMRISKMVNIDFKDIDESVISPDFLEKPMSEYSVNTQIQSILGIELWIKYKIAKLSVGSKQKIAKYNTIKDKWDIILKQLCSKKNETINKNEMTDNEKSNWIDYEVLRTQWVSVINDKLIQSPEPSYTEWRDLLLVSLFILIPPTRIGNYETMRIRYRKTVRAKSLKQDRNYIMINNTDNVNSENDKYSFCFNRYKTAKFVGQISSGVEDKTLIMVLDRYIKLRIETQPINKLKYEDTDLLFINATASPLKPLSQSYITETLKKTTNKYIGKKLSCDLFRKIFLTHFLNDNTKSIEDRKRMATFIGQTYNPTTMETYKKIPPTPLPVPIVLCFD